MPLSDTPSWQNWRFLITATMCVGYSAEIYYWLPFDFYCLRDTVMYFFFFFTNIGNCRPTIDMLGLHSVRCSVPKANILKLFNGDAKYWCWSKNRSSSIYCIQNKTIHSKTHNILVMKLHGLSWGSAMSCIRFEIIIYFQ